MYLVLLWQWTWSIYINGLEWIVHVKNKYSVSLCGTNWDMCKLFDEHCRWNESNIQIPPGQRLGRGTSHRFRSRGRDAFHEIRRPCTTSNLRWCVFIAFACRPRVRVSCRKILTRYCTDFTMRTRSPLSSGNGSVRGTAVLLRTEPQYVSIKWLRDPDVTTWPTSKRNATIWNLGHYEHYVKQTGALSIRTTTELSSACT